VHALIIVFVRVKINPKSSTNVMIEAPNASPSQPPTIAERIEYSNIKVT